VEFVPCVDVEISSVAGDGDVSTVEVMEVGEETEFVV
jgi:hypothetical protein